MRFGKTVPNILRVMHADDMMYAHPLTDWSYVCDKCQQGVGIYPSGQSIIKEIGRANLQLVCNRCLPEPAHAVISKAVLLEVFESVPYHKT